MTPQKPTIEKELEKEYFKEYPHSRFDAFEDDDSTLPKFRVNLAIQNTLKELKKDRIKVNTSVHNPLFTEFVVKWSDLEDAFGGIKDGKGN